jgi:hypothetical protein
MTVVTSADLTTLGSIDFVIPGPYTIDAAVRRSISTTRLQLVDDQAYSYLRSRISSFERELSERLGISASIVDGRVQSGSIRFRDGKLVVTSVALATMLTLGAAVSNYESLRTGVILIHGDIRNAIKYVAKHSKVEHPLFIPEAPEEILFQIQPFLLPEQRKLFPPREPPTKRR